MRFGALELFENSAQTLIGMPTDHGLAIGQGADHPIKWTQAPTDGQVLIGQTGDDPVLSTLLAGVNVSISNGPGTITISSAGGSGFVWQTISSNTTLTQNQGYVCTGGGALVLTLPASVLGVLIEVVLDGSSGWIIQAGAASIRIGGILVGPGGSLQSTNQGDAVRLVAQGSNKWNVISNIGNIIT